MNETIWEPNDRAPRPAPADPKDETPRDPVGRRRFLARAIGGTCLLCGAVAVAKWVSGKKGDAARPAWAELGALGAEQPAGDAAFVRDARHWETKGEVVVCKLCPRQCEVPRDERGYCGARENRGGQYKTLVYARACSMAIDPIEKKPLFHFVPGSQAFSLATAGCNIECKFCQNWQTSQMRPEQVESIYAPPEQVAGMAKSKGCRSIAFTYTEPVIFYEYAFDVAAEARKQGVYSVMISNGYIQKEPMTELCKELTAVKIDLKAFTESFYQDVCHGKLQPVLDTLELLKSLGLWFEIVVLVIPTLNDGEDECRKMCQWIKQKLGPDVPVHFTRFGPMYKLTNLPPTPVETLTRNYEIARAEGLHYPYVGNVAGHPGENTNCHSCGKRVIQRMGFYSRSELKPGGLCPYCQTKIPGIWA